ncbi:helix-turn-helix domain-containing protein [Pedobacter sp. HMF7647]|uniref:Helix-turn-helix domain-containing protein n=1 Tax=Hufsiella arboris TaxID=2695275 RepID=A0A7K1Y5S9_9SPHI|nr:helix-turn-helix transcriptional regulator [Hufsiella arboris]MXV49937.1 helix-turn-helix domain-containing protein [Hufsiella arboris]
MNKKDIGEKIRIQRVIKQYSQEYVANCMDISQAAYSKIERGETELSVERLYEIAEILEVSPFTFLPKPKHGRMINTAGLRKTIVTGWKRLAVLFG